jgi:hypothetical protein
MLHRTSRALAAAGLIAGFVMVLAPAASAHEGRKLGDLEMEVGFGTEPAYVGQPNSVQLLLVHDGDPVVDLGDTLDVEVTFGDAEPLQLTLEPFFEEGEFGTLGDYRAWFIPTSPGQYSFHFSGTVDGEDVDETFTSGPDTFSDVVGTDDIEYPVDVPSNAELAVRMDRLEPRLTSTIEDAQRAAVAQARAASNDASSARTVGMIGIAIGVVGLLVAIAALVLARRRTAPGDVANVP